MKGQRANVESRMSRPATCDLRLATHSRAFTLIELVIVIVLLALTAGITIQYLISASRIYTLLLAQKQADGEITDAVSRMRREARLAVQTITADSNTWSFLNVENKTNSFLRSGSDVNFNGKRLAAGVERFDLSYYDATNGLLGGLPLSTSVCAQVKRVAFDIRAVNNFSSSELKINFFLKDDLLK